MNKIEWWFEIVDTIAKKSHDIETQVGAILINNETGAILASGYNGFVRGVCDSKLPSTRPDKYDYIVHAEQNLICNCARHGIQMNNCTVVCSLSPCIRCMRYLWQCGIQNVLCKEIYHDIEHIRSLKDLSIDIEEKKLDNGVIYYSLTYSGGN